MDVNTIGDAAFTSGQFVMPRYKILFQPCHGTIFLLKTKEIWHFTNGINGHVLQYACVFLCFKENIFTIFKMPK
jgi:hypothetical protein